LSPSTSRDAASADAASQPDLVDVAVGVVIRADGKVLIGQRPAGKPYAGWWEFPGGKREPGEDIDAALARELHEELGLDVHASCAWVTREFVYPHAHVRLFFRRVYDFSGAPQSREGQSFAWVDVDGFDRAPLLPATVPVPGWLRLPPECAVSVAGLLGDDAFVAALERRLRTRRLRLLVLHEPGLDVARFERLFARVLPLCRQSAVPLLVGPGHAASFARAAQGALLSGDDLYRLDARPPYRLVAAACRDRGDLEAAHRLDVDLTVVDAALLARAAGTLRQPTYVIGMQVQTAIQAGAHGIVPGAEFWVED
jgi:8-oxo-dGTP diphosphatase